MIPRYVTDAEVDHFEAVDLASGAVDPIYVRTVLGGPEEGDDVRPCPTLISSAGVWRVAYVMDEIELTKLATGGTLWLSTWSQLPVHLLEVIR